MVLTDESKAEHVCLLQQSSAWHADAHSALKAFSNDAALSLMTSRTLTDDSKAEHVCLLQQSMACMRHIQL
jgi:hypothetical protein